MSEAIPNRMLEDMRKKMPDRILEDLLIFKI
jgi:hypothetical protein